MRKEIICGDYYKCNMLGNLKISVTNNYVLLCFDKCLNAVNVIYIYK